MSLEINPVILQDQSSSCGPLVVELDRLRLEPASPERSALVWKLLALGSMRDDYPIMLDYAYEHELAIAAEVMTGSRRRYQAPPRPIHWTHPLDGTELIWIHSGPFFLGKNNISVESEGFALARHPVTNAQFGRFVEETQYRPDKRHPENEKFLVHWPNGRIPKKVLNFPVVWISFIDALAYCSWARLALPTEWLWEKAARGSDGRIYPWGSESPLLQPLTWLERQQGVKRASDRYANVRDSETKNIEKYSHVRSPYGCENLVGNVAEWCWFENGQGLTNPSEAPRSSWSDPVVNRRPDVDEEVDRPAKNYDILDKVPPGSKSNHGQFPPVWTQELQDTYLSEASNQAPPLVAVRGSCYLRKDVNLMASSHRRRLSIFRRNHWTGFRVASFAAFRT